jgi:hypothetical protein
MRRPALLRVLRSLPLLPLLGGCQADPPPPRDWTAHPAVLELDPAGPVYAVSDVHSGYDRLVALLARHGLLKGAPVTPEAVEWTGGGATLIVAGDLFDKGPAGLQVVDLLRALQDGAARAGGRVVVTLGNHEAEFLADPLNDKADTEGGVTKELRARGLDPAAVARGADPRGRWLRELPFAARAGRWFFSHAGNTAGRTIAELEGALRAAAGGPGYGDKEILGKDSLLDSEGWYKDDKTIGARYAGAVGAAHIVFGHDPSALGEKGEIGEAQGGALFRIDCGMSPGVGYSEGALLRVESQGGREIASSLDAAGTIKELWTE